MWLALPGINKRTGIQIREYSYSEPQAGKSYCDSKIAHMRTKMKTYVASGKNILTANDMKMAIDSGAGVVGCQVATVLVDTTKQNLKSHKLKGVNAYTDIRYEENGMRLFKACGIGTGFFITFDELDKMVNCLQGETNLVIEENFSFPSKVQGEIKRTKVPEEDCNGQQIDSDIQSDNTAEDVLSPDADILCCPEIGCVKRYASFRGLETHILVGKHVFKLERQSTYDYVKEQWASICNDVCITIKTPASLTNIPIENQCVHTNMGWGLKRDRKIVRFSQHVKDFLINIFQEGEKSGKKANPPDVASQMRNLKNSEGNRVFKLSECLQISQITSFFSRLAVKEIVSVKEDKLDDEDLFAISALLDEASIIESLQ